MLRTTQITFVLGLLVGMSTDAYDQVILSQPQNQNPAEQQIQVPQELQRATPSDQPPVQAPSSQPTQPSATDQRGTDQLPLTVRVFPGPTSAEETEKAERERKHNEEKAAIDRRLADDTQRLADETNNLANYTGWLSIFTLFLFVAAILQVGLFWVQLKYMGRGLQDAKIAAEAARDGAKANQEVLIQHASP